MGTAAFAVPTLQECASHHDVVAVVTQPGKRGHRGLPAPRPVADAAAELQLPLIDPPRVRDPEAVASILSYRPDAVVVAAYGQILPRELLDGPPHGCLNVHASLLPRWRGATPVAHAILAGDAETGVSIMQMDPGLDTGPVHAQARVNIADEATTATLTTALAQLGSQLLIDVLAAVERGDAGATPQPLEGVTNAPRLRKEQGRLQWEAASAADIDRHVRALQPWPGVTLPLQGIEVRIVDGACAEVAADEVRTPGTVVRVGHESVLVAAKEGAYWVHHVVPPGSRAMTAAAFLRGRRAHGLR